MSERREIYFHEDDYCQQELLPREAAEFAAEELRKIDDFSDAHRAPSGAGWTDLYMRGPASVELSTLKIDRRDFAAAIPKSLPPFDAVFTGYSSYREACKSTAAWGASNACALFASWNEDNVIGSIWANFFGGDEESLRCATAAVAALGAIYPLIYVDWAWGYVCDLRDAASFESMLRMKLDTIAERLEGNVNS